MIVLRSNIKNEELYKMVTAKKQSFDTVADTVEHKVLGYAITDGKYSNGLVLQCDDDIYWTNDRPLVDSFETILSCFDVMPVIRTDTRTSNTTGRTYKVFVPVEQ